MIQQIDLSEKAMTTLLISMKTLKINKMLRDSNIRKSDGFAVNQIFQILILLVFQGKNLFRFLDSSQGLDLPSKDTYYRFLNPKGYATSRS